MTTRILLAVTLPCLAAASFSGPTTLTGSRPEDHFGTDVVNAGDVDGDGHVDLLVGSGNIADDARIDVALYLGGATGFASAPAVTWTGDAAEPYFGTVVAGGGDVNDDGYDDVLVGAPGETRGGVVGRVHLYYGGPAGPSTIPDVSWTGEGGFDALGTSAAFVGDLNGDGYDEIALGSPDSISGFGYVNIHFGTASGVTETPDLVWTGELAYDGFGQAIAGAGDVNGDGYGDIVIGADGYAAYTGRALVYLGGADGPAATAATTVVGEASMDQFGLAVAGVGDVDADGYDDVAIGAPYADTFTGRAYVYMGSATGVSASPATTWYGSSDYAAYGGSIAGAGDVDADGFDDVIVGASGDSGVTGATYVYTGSAAGISATAEVTLTGEAADNYFGGAVAGVDVTGDGYADVVAGAAGYDGYTGRVYVYEGVADAPTDADGDGYTAPEDCDDGDPAVHPGAPETDCADATDYDCDGVSSATDGDGDGFAACADCDDAAATVNPDAAEVCNGADDDCDGTADGADATGGTPWHRDADGDGYADPATVVVACATPEGYLAATAADCDDDDPAAHPGAADLPDDGIDQDCDGADATEVDGGEEGMDNADTGEDGKSAACGCATRGEPPASYLAALLTAVAGLRWRRRTAAG